MPPLLRYVLKWSCVGVVSILVIMDDRSRLESHLKSLNKLQALSKMEGSSREIWVDAAAAGTHKQNVVKA